MRKIKVVLTRWFPRHKALPSQAGFLRRGMAFIFDAIIISLSSLLIYLTYFEISAAIKEEPGIVSQAIKALKEGHGFTLRTKGDRPAKALLKKEYLKILQNRISPKDYEKAREMLPEEIYQAFSEEFLASGYKQTDLVIGETFNFIKEYIISLLYFVIFFRFGGRTPGKRIFRLKVVDLEGRARLGWYQCFERAHGYVCSGLFASLGFWQVLWNKKGLAMHDKLSGTTVIRLEKAPSKK